MKKSNAMRILDKAGIAYGFSEYDGEGGAINGEEIARRIGRAPEMVFKTLVTATPDKVHFVFVVPVMRQLDLKLAAKAANVRSLSMLPLQQLFPVTGYLHGGCSPVGLKSKMGIFFDSSATQFEEICLSGGRIGLNLCVEREALVRFLGAAYAAVSTK